MRAIVQYRYGDLDQLSYREDVDLPSPRRGEVAIAVSAASVNPGDRFRVSGIPRLGRLAFGLLRPKVPVLGIDVAGTVVAVGEGVTRWKIGDEVFGETLGSFAERVCAREDRVAARPRNVSLEEAAALPVAGITALQAMRDVAKVGPGSRVLVNGAAGGVGSFAIQIARALGAEVTAVCSGRNAALVSSLGAAHVIDYTRNDVAHAIEAGAAPYDAILDLVGTVPLARCIASLSERGVYVSSVGRTGWILRAALRSLVSRRVRLLVTTTSTANLEALAQLVDAGAVRPVIDRRFDLVHVPDALRYSATERTRGKSLVTVGGAGG
ncbi:MAG: NAD(P)-dependent alcohol dehydrogenase [Myxococcota bacterium]|jgi:NADPH:quinone reductase-like Zn-dependent oxidoreductase|nr:NAD(P)-dependent alcohol dehydrogenase [Myxococcota bacterium]